MTARPCRRKRMRSRPAKAFRTMTFVVIVAALVAAAVRALRGAAVPALEPASPASKPGPVLRADTPADNSSAEAGPAGTTESPDWVGPEAAPVEAYPLAVPPEVSSMGEPAPDVAAPPENDTAWVPATGGAAPPDSHRIKAKLGSGIYHVPGMLNYDRTNPDRYYRSAEEAEADGLRPAKR